MGYDTHDIEVTTRINRIIALVNTRYPDSSVAEKIEFAWSANVKEREADSTNTVGRDADYYFAARKEVANSNNNAAKGAKALVGNLGWVVYAALKKGSEAVGHSEWMRTDKDKPNAPVGGLGWMNRGSADGFLDAGGRLGDVTLHQPSDLPPPAPAPTVPRP